MTTPIRVFPNGSVCPNGTNTCCSCRACGATHCAVRPPSMCSSECAGGWQDYPNIATAMAEHPDIEWWQLPVVFGEDPEPELVAAMNAHLAGIVVGPA